MLGSASEIFQHYLPRPHERDYLLLTAHRRTVLAALAASSTTGLVAACGDASRSSTPADASLSRFAVNIETWWRGLPLQERIKAAASAGFAMIEMWWLNEDERHPETLQSIAADYGTKIVHCVASLPPLAGSTDAEVRDAAKVTLDRILRLGVKLATVASHQLQDGMTTGEMKTRYTERLASVVPIFEEAGVLLLLEPFNPFDHPESFLFGSADAVKIVDEIASPSLRLNWDLFHMQRAEGNVITTFTDHFKHIGYVQLADAPQRHQPGTGEMNYANILNAVLASGYRGPIGLECFPKDGDDDQAVADVLALHDELSLG